MKIQSILYCLLFALLLCGCEKDSSNGLWTTKDSWYHPAINSRDEPSHTLPDKEVYETTASNLARAEALLEHQSIVPIPLQQAEVFVNHSLPKVLGKSTFLVRAVYLNAGAFSLYLQGNRLWVTHGSLGHYAVPMKRQALVVFLQKQPNEVFVYCSRAE